MMRLLISTDLDGTLLDHYSYSAAAAESQLRTLQTLDIPWILNTSKTLAELEPLRQCLGHRDPFVVENGAAVYIPAELPVATTTCPQIDGRYRRQTFGPDRSRILNALAPLSRRYRFTGFAAMTTDSIVRLTGLAPEAAAQALQRQFTEPLVWQDSAAALDDFAAELALVGLQIQRGGRFVHVMGHCDKAAAMGWLAGRYGELWNEPVTTLALGDGENDIGMLQQADIAVLVRSPAHPPPAVPGRADIRLTDETGPAGWSQAVKQTLTELGLGGP
ncbi:HAD-IIB family hydrolase [Marinobacterium aestuariivivens]|uniref:HAD-IIB family hydrolase n=1 Tax=Marinobacterium aestuariivivens TaxID=1698799 RepID=A0ABW1ZYA1_9GAMM